MDPRRPAQRCDAERAPRGAGRETQGIFGLTAVGSRYLFSERDRGTPEQDAPLTNKYVVVVVKQANWA
jgi:hypothetical protein